MSEIKASTERKKATPKEAKKTFNKSRSYGKNKSNATSADKQTRERKVANQGTAVNGEKKAVNQSVKSETEQKSSKPMRKRRNTDAASKKKFRNSQNNNQSKKPIYSELIPDNKVKFPKIPKNEKGIFDFSEQELQEDTDLKVISRRQTDTNKYANFEAYLKDKKI